MTQTTFDAHPRSSLIVALDFDSLSSAVKFATQLADLVGMFKIGNQLFTAAGPAAVKEISALGRGVFLDLKYHDIPNTVAGAVLSAAGMAGVELLNVHALGGKAMMEVGVGGTPKSRVVKLALLAKESGVDGVVASVQEARAIRKACGDGFLIVTPGVRPPDSELRPSADDQSRKASPREAIRAGADFVVVGRPILASAEPRVAAQSIVDEIAAAK